MIRLSLFALISMFWGASALSAPVFSYAEMEEIAATYNKAVRAHKEMGPGALVKIIAARADFEEKTQLQKLFSPELEFLEIEINPSSARFKHSKSAAFMPQPILTEHLQHGVVWINGERIDLLTLAPQDIIKKANEMLFSIGNHFSLFDFVFANAFAQQKKGRLHERLREKFKKVNADSLGLIGQILQSSENIKIEKAEFQEEPSRSGSKGKSTKGGSHSGGGGAGDLGSLGNMDFSPFRGKRAKQHNERLKKQNQEAYNFDENDPRYRSGNFAKLIASAERRAGRAGVGSGRNKRSGTSNKPTNKSTGMCWRYVKQALWDAELVNSYPGTGSAKQAIYELPKHGFRKCNYSNPARAPIGAVIVYQGDKHGHVEIKTGSSRYTSDYISSRPLRSSATILVKGTSC